MPAFKNRTAFELTRNIRLSLQVEGDLTGVVARFNRLKSRLGIKPGPPKAQVSTSRELAKNKTGSRADAVRSGNIVWIVGGARTGSTWLLSMMKEIDGCVGWNEPMVGDIFGYAYNVRGWEWQRKRDDYLLSNRYKEAWLGSIRNTILDGAAARFPGFDGHVIIKEPNGSLGVSLLSESVPESRMVLLMRDPRDVVASLLDANRKGNWLDTYSLEEGWSANRLADEDPTAFVEKVAGFHVQNIDRVTNAYKTHEGPKTTVRYEDLRVEPLETLAGLYAALEIHIDKEAIARIVEKHAWEKIPTAEKGAGKFNRKGLPGGWREDLTLEQARIVENIAASILDEFYPGWK